MLDIPAPTSSAYPQHWLAAALPWAQVCQLQGSGLLQLASGATTKVSAPLRQALQDTAATARTIVVVDKAGAPWRLRRAAGKPSDLWLLQSLVDSRRIALQNFRSAFAARLADSLLHELRNPLNALGLQCDLLGRTLKISTNADVLAQVTGRVSQMKERLRDLLERQNSMVGLWLSAADPEVRLELATLVDETLRLLRSYGSQREVRLQADDLAALRDVATPGDGVAIRIVLIAIGLLAIDSAASAGHTDDDAQVQLQTTSSSAAAAVLEIRAQFTATTLSGELQFAGFDEWLATLALLLDESPIELSHSAASSSIRLRFPFEKSSPAISRR
ncbi:MAG: sensor histidine kinase [Nevskia sp.]|nr:sensor histidine kinase [Nevskia sp.]